MRHGSHAIELPADARGLRIPPRKHGKSAIYADYEYADKIETIRDEKFELRQEEWEDADRMVGQG